MALSYIQVAADGVGKKVLNLLQSIGGVDHYQQVIAIGDPVDTSQQATVVAGRLQVDAGSVTTGPVTIASGADATEGAILDAAVVTDTTGTVSGKLRGLVKWAFERMPAALGQAAMAASLPVVIASDQPAVPVSAAALPLPAGAATEAGHLAAIDTATARIPTQGQAVAAASTPVVLPAAQITTLTPPAAITGFGLEATQLANGVLIGPVNETAPVNDTANSGLNGRLQRVAQRLTTMIGLLPAALGQGTMAQGLRVVLPSDQTAIPVTASAGTNLNTSLLGLETTQVAGNVLTGAVNETAPANDTANSGLNGRLQRIAQRLTTLLAVFPATLAVNSGNKDASTLRVVLATDQPTVPTSIVKTDLTPSVPTAASVGVASAQVVAANANRKGLILVNTSANRISLGFGATAVLDSGVTLMASGGAYNMGEYDFDAGAVNAIASGAASNLSIQEYTT